MEGIEKIIVRSTYYFDRITSSTNTKFWVLIFCVPFTRNVKIVVLLSILKIFGFLIGMPFQIAIIKTEKR